MDIWEGQDGYRRFLAGKWVSFVDSPPVEGEEVLLSDGVECWIGRWQKRGGATLPGDLSTGSVGTPAYWLPLPFPPKEKDEDEQVV